MKDYSNYKKEINMMEWSAKKLFDVQLKGQEGYDVDIDGFPCRVLIQEHTNPMNEFKEERVIVCSLDIDIHRGSVITIGNEKYLTISDIDNNKFHKKAKLTKCNYTLNLSETVQLPCIVEDAVKYSSGVDEGKYMKLPDGQLLITLPDIEEIEVIKQDYRLMLYGKTFGVTYDNRTQTGIVKFTVVQDATQEQDDPINGVAYNPITLTPPTQTFAKFNSLMISGSDTLVINRTQSYEVNSDGNYRFDLDNGCAVIMSTTPTSCVLQGVSKGVVVLTGIDLVSGQQIEKTITVKSLL